MVGRGQLTVGQFDEILEGKDPSKVNFNVPAKGLFLEQCQVSGTLSGRLNTLVQMWKCGRMEVWK